MSILVFFIILSILVLIHEFGHFIAAKKNNVYVEEFGFGLPPRIWGIKKGETLYSLNLLPFGGFVKVLGEEEHEIHGKKLSPELANRTFVSKKPAVKILILTAGVIANFLLGWVIISYLFTQGVPTPTDTVIVESVVANSPAQKAGIKPGDEIERIIIASKTIELKNIDHFVEEIKKTGGKTIELDVVAAQEKQSQRITLTPRLNPPKGEGALGVVLTPFTIIKYPWYQAPFFGLIESAKISGVIARELFKVVINFASLKGPGVDVAGPVGIARITSQAVKVGNNAVLQLLGLLSLNLAIINILPFPALDGGRLAFVLYETISRKKINPTIERQLNFLGFAILLGLILLVTINDIVKLL